MTDLESEIKLHISASCMATSIQVEKEASAEKKSRIEIIQVKFRWMQVKCVECTAESEIFLNENDETGDYNNCEIE